MSQPFLTVFDTINHANPQQSMGFWLAHGDEPLLQQWLGDSLVTQWQQLGFGHQRIELVSSKTWYDIISELNSLSLFEPASAVIVTGNHKPDKDAIAKLTDMALSNHQNNNSANANNTLLWLTDKLDKRALSSKWIAPFKQHGQIVECRIYDERQRQQILAKQANQFGIQLTQQAWSRLLEQTQNNLLQAHQTLWRLSFLWGADELKEPLTDKQLQAGLVSHSQFSVYDLSEAILTGNVQQVVKIVHALKYAKEPESLVLWVLAKDVRLLQQLSSGQSMQSLGIWQSKQQLYASALQRNSYTNINNWSEQLYRCDQSIKGVIKQPAWEILLQLALSMSGNALPLMDTISHTKTHNDLRSVN